MSEKVRGPHEHACPDCGCECRALVQELDRVSTAAEEVVAAAIDHNEVLTRRQSDAIGVLERALNQARDPSRSETERSLDEAELPYIDGSAGRKEGRGIAMTPAGTPAASSEDRTHEPLVTARLNQSGETADREAAGVLPGVEPATGSHREGSRSPIPNTEYERGYADGLAAIDTDRLQRALNIEEE